MKNRKFILDSEEQELLESIENDEWEERKLTNNEKEKYKEYALYTKSLEEKKQTTIRFSVNDLAMVKAKSKELGIGYQNIIQALVHNFATGKIKLEL